jgi:Ca-activated chloride channel family protein
MTWNQSLGSTEYLFIFFFVLAYVVYVGRTVWIAHRLRTTARSIALKIGLRAGALALLVAALLDPSFGETERDLNAVGKDVYVLVDLSRSMDARDVQPSRLEKVKFELRRLIEQTPADRFGLIVFTSDAYVQCPLTFDIPALTLFIESLSTRLIERQGTDLAAPLALAMQKHLGATAATNTAKLLVLITDGEQFGEVPRQVLRDIRRYGITLFVVGVGSVQGSRIPVPGGPLRDAEGRVVVSRLDESGLRRLAEQTRGQYFSLNPRVNEFAQLATALERVEGRLIDRRKVAVTANRYYYFLWLALFLLAIDVVVTVRTLQL